MKKTFIAIVAVIITSASIFLACSKDSENEEVKNSTKKTDIIVGFLSKDKNANSAIEATFDKSAFLQRLQDTLNSLFNTPIVAEDIELYFDSVRSNTSYPMMKVSYLNVTEEAFYTTFFQLKTNHIANNKKNVSNSNMDVYFSVSDNEDGYCICRGKNCDGGCFVLRDEKDRPYGCSPCPNRKGECYSQVKVPYTVSSILSAF